jgi:N-acetylglucosaminyldiphosphoundecaprenol N-acetyl-beta-D-mannosaminyltransferase
VTIDFEPQIDAAPRSVPEISTVDVLGVPLAVTDYQAVMDWMDAMIDARRPACVSAAAVHLVMLAQEDEETRQAVLRATTVPDGQPLVWALRALGHREATRVYGPELMARYCARAAMGAGTRFFLYGGRDENALEELCRALRRRFPGLNIVGGYSPPFRPLTEAERESVAEQINASGADLVWVGTGQPKQEKWMAEMRDRISPPVLVGVGAAFDFHAGLVPQAPAWLQAIGLEWLYRLAHEPRRLWRRYARYNPRFVLGFARQYLAHRVAR